MLLPLNIDVTLEEEIEKAKEEFQEFLDGINNKDIDNSIEEFYDCVQVMTNVLNKAGISQRQVRNGLSKHIIKMSNRGYLFQEVDR